MKHKATNESNNESKNPTTDNQGGGVINQSKESTSIEFALEGNAQDSAHVVPKEQYDALLKRLSEQDAKFDLLLQKFNEIKSTPTAPAPAPIVLNNSTIQSEHEAIKNRYDSQFENATLLELNEQVIYYCYKWAYPVMGYLHDKTRKFVHPPFIKSNGKPDDIVFVAHATQMDEDPIDGKRPVPYAMFRAKYKEEVEFLDNHPGFGSLFYKHQPGNVRKDDLKAAGIRAAIGAQINNMSPNGISQKCQQFGVVYDPHNLKDARKLLLDAMYKAQLENVDDRTPDEIVTMFANAARTQVIDGTPVAVQDLSGIRNSAL